MNRLSARNTMFEYFVVSALVVFAVTVSFIFLSTILASARDMQRLSDIAALRSALVLYYRDHGRYPATGWANSAAAYCNLLVRELGSYVTAMPREPKNDPSGQVEHTGA
ncbi:MAG: hypothetical protein U1A28_03835, partial [Patescibacteria group bacterium]|nr:hypothetical protein [Patescibacteria group bacterium]